MWFYTRPEVSKTYLPPEVYTLFVKDNPTRCVVHTMVYTSLTLPKRILLGDAIEQNPFHLLYYMIARFYFVDNGIDEIIYYYPKTSGNHLATKAFSCLPPRFRREQEQTPGFEYVELPACKWYIDWIEDPWIYAYIRDLYKEIWQSTPVVKGKYTYISRNRNECTARRCLNEDELIAPLKQLGFSCYSLKNLTFEEQIRLFRSSEFITGVHGAGFSWLAFCAPGTVFCELATPKEYALQHHYHDICQKMHLKYYALVDPNFCSGDTFQETHDLVVDIPKYCEYLKHILTQEFPKN